MKLDVLAASIGGLAILASCETSEHSPLSQAQLDSVRVVTPDLVDYVPLNPARGDASPQAGVLWGDIRGGCAIRCFAEIRGRVLFAAAHSQYHVPGDRDQRRNS